MVLLQMLLALVFLCTIYIQYIYLSFCLLFINNFITNLILFILLCEIVLGPIFASKKSSTDISPYFSVGAQIWKLTKFWGSIFYREKKHSGGN